jgi:hypothetical protein
MRAAGAEKILSSMQRADSLIGLSAPQRQFAERQGARPGSYANARGIFLYRETPWATYRWLVDAKGDVLDAARFFKAA